MLKTFRRSIPNLLFTPDPVVQLTIAFCSGLLMGLTPAPGNVWPLAWIAIAPLWVLLLTKQPTNKKTRIFHSSFSLGFVWGVGYHGLAISWIRDLHPLTWMGVPWLASVAIALFVWSAIALWGGLLVGTWAWAMHLLCHFSLSDFKTWITARLNAQSSKSTRSPFSTSSSADSAFDVEQIPKAPAWLRILIGVALWCALESLWSSGALWWTSISFTQSPHNLAILHLGQLSGPNTVVAAIAAVNGIFAEAWFALIAKHPSKLRTLLIANGLLLIGLHLIGFGLYSQPLSEQPDTALNIGIIQGNIPTRIKLSGEGIQRAAIAYTEGYRALADQGVDAVLTSEGALPYYWFGINQARDPLYQAIVAKQIPIWLGTPGLQDGSVTQSLFTIIGTGEPFSRYNKIKLVPLGEYVPFQSVVGKFINRISPVDLSMQPGRPDPQFHTPFGQAIAGICYDSAFARLFRNQAATGGQFILTASNNDPYGQAMMAQHHAQDVMRAIETDRWAARGTNTGLSGIVNPHGNTLWLSGFRTYETHIATIYRRQTKTPYVRWGDWLTPLLVIAAGIGWSVNSLFCRAR